MYESFSFKGFPKVSFSIAVFIGLLAIGFPFFAFGYTSPDLGGGSASNPGYQYCNTSGFTGLGDYSWYCYPPNPWAPPIFQISLDHTQLSMFYNGGISEYPEAVDSYGDFYSPDDCSSGPTCLFDVSQFPDGSYFVVGYDYNENEYNYSFYVKNGLFYDSLDSISLDGTTTPVVVQDAGNLQFLLGIIIFLLCLFFWTFVFGNFKARQVYKK